MPMAGHVVEPARAVFSRHPCVYALVKAAVNPVSDQLAIPVIKVPVVLSCILYFVYCSIICPLDIVCPKCKTRTYLLDLVCRNFRGELPQASVERNQTLPLSMGFHCYDGAILVQQFRPAPSHDDYISVIHHQVKLQTVISRPHALTPKNIRPVRIVLNTDFTVHFHTCFRHVPCCDEITLRTIDDHPLRQGWIVLGKNKLDAYTFVRTMTVVIHWQRDAILGNRV